MKKIAEKINKSEYHSSKFKVGMLNDNEIDLIYDFQFNDRGLSELTNDLRALLQVEHFEKTNEGAMSDLTTLHVKYIVYNADSLQDYKTIRDKYEIQLFVQTDKENQDLNINIKF